MVQCGIIGRNRKMEMLGSMLLLDKVGLCRGVTGQKH